MERKRERTNRALLVVAPMQFYVGWWLKLLCNFVYYFYSYFCFYLDCLSLIIVQHFGSNKCDLTILYKKWVCLLRFVSSVQEIEGARTVRMKRFRVPPSRDREM